VQEFFFIQITKGIINEAFSAGNIEKAAIVIPISFIVMSIIGPDEDEAARLKKLGSPVDDMPASAFSEYEKLIKIMRMFWGYLAQRFYPEGIS
jgi:hypothetical protein